VLEAVDGRAGHQLICGGLGMCRAGGVDLSTPVDESLAKAALLITTMVKQTIIIFMKSRIIFTK
jgi:hypothetical protein